MYISIGWLEDSMVHVHAYIPRFKTKKTKTKKEKKKHHWDNDTFEQVTKTATIREPK